MSKANTARSDSDSEEREAAPLVLSVVDLPMLQNKFKSTSTGSMELVGLRERKPVKVSEFESQYRQPEDTTSTVAAKVKEAIAKRRSKFSLKRVLMSNFPILSALKKYKPLRDLPNDVVAGLTAGIMMIPQGGSAFNFIAHIYATLFVMFLFF